MKQDKLPNPLDLPASEARDFYVLSQLAQAGIDLKPEEADAVLNRVPFILVGDDERAIREIVYGFMTRGRKDIQQVLRLEGENMDRIFDDIAKKRPDQQAFVLCHDGEQAKIATEIIRDRRIDANGILMLDHLMGFNQPKGLEIFRGHNGDLGPYTRVLMSGTMPDEAEQSIHEGHLDLALQKPLNMSGVLRSLATTYLRKVYPVEE